MEKGGESRERIERDERRRGGEKGREGAGRGREGREV